MIKKEVIVKKRSNILTYNTPIENYIISRNLIKEDFYRLEIKDITFFTIFNRIQFNKLIGLLTSNPKFVNNIIKFPTGIYIKDTGLKRRLTHTIFNIYKHQISTKLGRT